MPAPIAKGTKLDRMPLSAPRAHPAVESLISFPRTGRARANHHAGILVTVSVLVAAGVAVYNSPQFQEWMTNSRRKLAVALHNLGDEIQPRDSQEEDISMNEEVGEAAEERRRIARAEIMRRASLLESLSRARDSSEPLDSFDNLVDQDGNLLLPKDVQGQIDGDIMAKSTSVDTGAHQPFRRGINPDIPDDAIKISMNAFQVS